MSWSSQFPGNTKAIQWKEQELLYKSKRNTKLKESWID